MIPLKFQKTKQGFIIVRMILFIIFFYLKWQWMQQGNLHICLYKIRDIFHGKTFAGVDFSSLWSTFLKRLKCLMISGYNMGSICKKKASCTIIIVLYHEHMQCIFKMIPVQHIQVAENDQIFLIGDAIYAFGFI